MSSTIKCHLLNDGIYHSHPIMLLVIITFKNGSLRSNQICRIHSNCQLSSTSNDASNRMNVTTTKTSRYTSSHSSTSLIFDGSTGYYFSGGSETFEINPLLHFGKRNVPAICISVETGNTFVLPLFTNMQKIWFHKEDSL